MQKKIEFSGDLEAPLEKSGPENAKGPPFEAEIFFVFKLGFRGVKLTGLMSSIQKCKNISIFLTF